MNREIVQQDLFNELSLRYRAYIYVQLSITQRAIAMTVNIPVLARYTHAHHVNGCMLKWKYAEIAYQLRHMHTLYTRSISFCGGCSV